MGRFVVPETVRLPLSQGDWILVKKRLTAGEARRVFARTIKRMAINETTEIDPVQVGLAEVTEYLLDWSLVDAAGKPVVVRETATNARAAILEGLELETFNEIWNVIQAHETAMTAERAEEKKISSGANGSDPISGSVA